jgi:hypothetical protein
MVDDKLKQYATPRQIEILEAIERTGSQRAAAKELGLARGTIFNLVQSAKKRAAKSGHSPEHDMTHTVPDGFLVKGVSTMYAKDGSIAAQWVKSSIDRERQEAIMRAAVDAMVEDIRPAAPVAPPELVLDKLLNCYVITDYHLGAKAWAEETGASWDLHIAEDMLVQWFSAAIAQSPASHTAVLVNLGDLMHWDGIEAVTPTSKHTLDADTRFQKLVRVTIAVLRRVVSMLLQKHQHVHFLMAEGNHDLASSAWLRELFAALYIDEPRVTVETRPDPYYCIEHGKTALFFHHGHKKRFDSLETVFVAKFREVYGRTKYAYAHTGHLHHNVVKETNTMTLEQHRTLAAPDSHASRGGWMSGRDAKVVTYHKDFGEVGRISISPEMIGL